MAAGVSLPVAVVAAFLVTLLLFALFPDKPKVAPPVAWCDVPNALMPDFNGMAFFPCRALPLKGRA